MASWDTNISKSTQPLPPTVESHFEGLGQRSVRGTIFGHHAHHVVTERYNDGTYVRRQILCQSHQDVQR